MSALQQREHHAVCLSLQDFRLTGQTFCWLQVLKSNHSPPEPACRHYLGILHHGSCRLAACASLTGLVMTAGARRQSCSARVFAQAPHEHPGGGVPQAQTCQAQHPSAGTPCTCRGCSCKGRPARASCGAPQHSKQGAEAREQQIIRAPAAVSQADCSTAANGRRAWSRGCSGVQAAGDWARLGAAGEVSAWL